MYFYLYLYLYFVSGTGSVSVLGFAFFKQMLLHNNYLRCDWTWLRVKLVNTTYLLSKYAVFINLSVIRVQPQCKKLWCTNIEGMHSLGILCRHFGTIYPILDPLTLDDGTDRLSRNVDKKLSFCAAQNPRRWQVSFAPRWKPKIVQGIICFGRGYAEGRDWPCPWNEALH